MRTRVSGACILFIAGVLSLAPTHALDRTSVEVKLRLAFGEVKRHQIPPAVLWLKTTDRTSPLAFAPHSQYRLQQKDRTFTPHLLVVPVGSVVLFPNADPFFHNVFSLFEGKRFDLGLYEAGSTKEVTFSREGISYIFCNIHPEMSAVVLALSTPVYATADSDGTFRLSDVPAGDYELHVWVEGTPQPILDHLTRRVHLTPGTDDLGELVLPAIAHQPSSHLNKFGRPYDKDSRPTY